MFGFPVLHYDFPSQSPNWNVMKRLRILVATCCLLLILGCASDKKRNSTAKSVSPNPSLESLTSDKSVEQAAYKNTDPAPQTTTEMTAEKSAPASDVIKKKQGFAESFLFQPLKYPKGFDRMIIEGQRVQFKSEDGTELDGRYFRGVKPKGIIVFCHGNGGNLAGRSARMHQLQQKHNYSVFIFDYRGYGRSQGKPTVSGVVADGRAAVRKAAELANMKPEDVIVMGRSMGGAVAVQVANYFQSKALIVESSFTSFKDVAKYHVGWISAMANKQHLTSEADIKNYRGRVLISHGTEDNVVPYDHGQRLYAAANQPKLFYKIENGGHNDPMPATYDEVLKKFLSGL